jgi:hypothetical protein
VNVVVRAKDRLGLLCDRTRFWSFFFLLFFWAALRRPSTQAAPMHIKALPIVVFALVVATITTTYVVSCSLGHTKWFVDSLALALSFLAELFHVLKKNPNARPPPLIDYIIFEHHCAQIFFLV